MELRRGGSRAWAQFVVWLTSCSYPPLLGLLVFPVLSSDQPFDLVLVLERDALGFAPGRGTSGRRERERKERRTK